MPPKKNLSSLREISRREKIVSGAAHFDFAQYEPPPFRIFALLRLLASDGQAGGNSSPRRGGTKYAVPVCSFSERGFGTNSRILHNKKILTFISIF